jgi:hypothetical protein
MPSTFRATFPGAASVMRKTAIETKNIVNNMRSKRRMMNLAICCAPSYTLLSITDGLVIPSTATSWLLAAVDGTFSQALFSHRQSGSEQALSS